MPHKDGSPEELTDAIPARAMRQRKVHYQEYLTYLRLAKRIREDIGRDTAIITSALSQGQDEYAQLVASSGGRIVRRAHPKVSSTEQCTVFIDESGSHTLSTKEKFKAFSLGAVIIKNSDYDVFDALWKQWKRTYLGNPGKLVHEPDLRKREGSFYCNGDAARQATALLQIDEIIEKLPFSAICCVLNREKYIEKWGFDAPDESLPPKTLANHVYVMMLGFLAERVALTLQQHYDGAKGKLVLEARDPFGDALLQYEFSRLFLDGTSFISAAYFRHQFLPGLRFITKDTNNSGMQMADLLARPCADKMLALDTDPPRWRVFQQKLCRGRVTKHSILGLKVIPWDACYDCMIPEDAVV
jgi:hypothetical protein